MKIKCSRIREWKDKLFHFPTTPKRKQEKCKGNKEILENNKIRMVFCGGLDLWFWMICNVGMYKRYTVFCFIRKGSIVPFACSSFIFTFGLWLGFLGKMGIIFVFVMRKEDEVLFMQLFVYVIYLPMIMLNGLIHKWGKGLEKSSRVHTYMIYRSQTFPYL